MSARESTARAFAWFGAAYPTARKMDQSTVEVWAEACYQFSGDAIETAARHWIRTEARFPSLAGFIETIRAKTPSGSVAATAWCAVCEGEGWEYMNHEGRGMVTRCRNGCLPPPMSHLYDKVGANTADPETVARLRETLSKLARR